jgi:hypothetical protein
MPAGDHTGPLGQGPRTGRAAGYCAGYDRPGFQNPIPGYGQGLSRGRGAGRAGGGHGWRHWFYATGLTGWQRGGRGGWRTLAPYDLPPPTREQELSLLQADVQCLEQHAARLRRRIDELNAQETKKTSA